MENKSYLVKKKFSNQQITGGAFMMILGIIMLLVMGNGMLIPLGALLLYIGFWQKDREVFKLYDEHIEFKAAPLTSLKLIKYKDIIRIEKVSEKKLVITHKVMDKLEKRVTLPIVLISDEDQKELIERLNELIN